MTEEELSHYKDFVYKCDILERDPHDGSPSVNVMVTTGAVPDRKPDEVVNWHVRIFVYTGAWRYTLEPRGFFKLTVEQAQTLEDYIKDAVSSMNESGEFDALITMHEL